MMSRFNRNLILLAIAASTLFALCGLAIGVMPFAVVRVRLDALSGDGSADVYTSRIHSFFRAAGWLVCFATGVLTIVLIWRRRAAEHWLEQNLPLYRIDAQAYCQAGYLAVRSSWRWVLLLLVLAVLVRIPYASQSIGFDEAYTYLKYAQRPIPLIVTRYEAPNNHVFHSVLAHLSTRIFGDAPFAIRAPAFLAGVLTPVFTYFLMRGREALGARRMASLLVAVWPQIVFYSVNARGYTLATALFLIACLSTRSLLREGNRFAWLTVIFSLGLAIWTLPTMLYAAVGLFSWLFLQKVRMNGRKATGGVVLAGLLTVALAVLLYSPILLTLSASRGLSSAALYSKPLADLLTGAPTTLIALYVWFFWAVPIWAQISLIGGFAWAVGHPTTRESVGWAIAASLSVLAPILLQRIEPPSRIWIFATPLFLVAACYGLTLIERFLLKRVAYESLRGWDASVLGIVLTVAIAWRVLSFGPVLWSPETAIFPQAETITRELRDSVRENEPIVTVTPSSSTVHYYALQVGLASVHFGVPGQGATNDATALVVVSKSFQQSPQDVLGELKLDSLFDSSTAIVVKDYQTATVYRVQAIGSH